MEHLCNVQQRLEAQALHVQVEHEPRMLSNMVLRVRALSARELERDRHRAALRPLPLRVRLLLLDVTHETSGGDEREELQEEHRVVLVDRAARRPDALRVLTRQLTEFSCLVGAAYRSPPALESDECAMPVCVGFAAGVSLPREHSLQPAPERRVVRLARQHRHADRLSELLQQVRRIRHARRLIEEAVGWRRFVYEYALGERSEARVAADAAQEAVEEREEDRRVRPGIWYTVQYICYIES